MPAGHDPDAFALKQQDAAVILKLDGVAVFVQQRALGGALVDHGGAAADLADAGAVQPRAAAGAGALGLDGPPQRAVAFDRQIARLEYAVADHDPGHDRAFGAARDPLPPGHRRSAIPTA